VKPVIGLSTYREPAYWGVWDCLADVLHASYADAVIAAGGVPFLLPPGSADKQDAVAAVGRIDGLLLTGGADIEPSRYANRVHPQTNNWRPLRDNWELALLEGAEQSLLPVLGVCRGMQLMAVAAGGSLHQHTPDQVGHNNHGPAPGEFGMLEISVECDSIVGRAVDETHRVACHHHQSVASHPGYLPVAWAMDGSVEAIEHTTHPYRVGVQWHPEASSDNGIVESFVQAAKELM
jgi:putative glutamine amidotransferase